MRVGLAVAIALLAASCGGSEAVDASGEEPGSTSTTVVVTTSGSDGQPAGVDAAAASVDVDAFCSEFTALMAVEWEETDDVELAVARVTARRDRWVALEDAAPPEMEDAVYQSVVRWDEEVESLDSLGPEIAPFIPVDSERSLDNRLVDFDRLVCAAESGPADAYIVWSQERIARRAAEEERQAEVFYASTLERYLELGATTEQATCMADRLDLDTVSWILDYRQPEDEDRMTPILIDCGLDPADFGD